jgi:hypothetical protein
VDSCGQRRRDLRIANVRDMSLAVREHEVMNVGVQCLADLAGGTREINDQTVGVHAIDGKAVGFQPAL